MSHVEDEQTSTGVFRLLAYNTHDEQIKMYVERTYYRALANPKQVTMTRFHWATFCRKGKKLSCQGYCPCLWSNEHFFEGQNIRNSFEGSGKIMLEKLSIIIRLSKDGLRNAIFGIPSIILLETLMFINTDVDPTS